MGQSKKGGRSGDARTGGDGRFNADRAEVELVSDRSEGPLAGIHRFSALEFLARWVDHVPDRYETRVRYYGAYATRRRVWWWRNIALAKLLAAEADAERIKERDVVPWLRQLGYRADEARHAALRCAAIPDASPEERVRVALAFLRPRTASRDFGPPENRVRTAA